MNRKLNKEKVAKKQLFLYLYKIYLLFNAA